MKLFKWQKQIIDEYNIQRILNEFIENIKTPIIILYKINKNNILNLYSNRPGVLIGPAGRDINYLTSEIQKITPIKEIKIYEIKNIINNCNIY